MSPLRVLIRSRSSFVRPRPLSPTGANLLAFRYPSPSSGTAVGILQLIGQEPPISVGLDTLIGSWLLRLGRFRVCRIVGVRHHRHRGERLKLWAALEGTDIGEDILAILT